MAAVASQAVGISAQVLDTDQVMEIRSPMTGDVVGVVPRMTSDEVAEAVLRARAAQKAWAALPFRERARVFIRFHDVLLDQRNAIFDVLQAESGKSRRD